jgi:hypothetical protein
MKNYNINLVKESGVWFCELVITKKRYKTEAWSWGKTANEAFSFALENIEK